MAVSSFPYIKFDGDTTKSQGWKNVVESPYFVTDMLFIVYFQENKKKLKEISNDFESQLNDVLKSKVFNLSTFFSEEESGYKE